MTSQHSPVRTTVTGYIRYRGREGHYAFLLHRITGLGTLFFLVIHIVDTSFVYFFPSLYEHTITLYRHPVFMIGEIFLVFSVIYHGVNGLRIAYVDLFKPDNWTIKKQRNASRWTLGLSIVLWLPAAVIMFRSLLAHI